MIDRQGGKIVIECDACDETFEGATGLEWAEVWSIAKRDGWTVRKVGEEWLHRCPTCGPDR